MASRAFDSVARLAHLPPVAPAGDVANGTLMGEAASRFLAALGPDRFPAASDPCNDPERINWHSIPRPRKGLPIKAMNSAQQSLAFGLLKIVALADPALQLVQSLDHIDSLRRSLVGDFSIPVTTSAGGGSP